MNSKVIKDEVKKEDSILVDKLSSMFCSGTTPEGGTIEYEWYNYENWKEILGPYVSI